MSASPPPLGWECPQCGAHNFGSRSVCLQCGASYPARDEKPPAFTPHPSEMETLIVSPQITPAEVVSPKPAPGRVESPPPPPGQVVSPVPLPDRCCHLSTSRSLPLPDVRERAFLSLS